MQVQKPSERKWREPVAWFAQPVLLGHAQDRLELSFIELATRFDGLDFQARPIKARSTLRTFVLIAYSNGVFP
jgi:hypothetical protein